MAKKKGKKPGRPRLPGAKREKLTFKLSAEDLARYETAATAAGKPLSTWVRETLDRNS